MEEKEKQRKPEIKPIHFTILCRIKDDPTCATEIGHHLKKDYRYILNVTCDMKKLGLISKSSSDKDRRIRKVSATPRGIIILRAYEKQQNEESKIKKILKGEIKSALEFLNDPIANFPIFNNG